MYSHPELLQTADQINDLVDRLRQSPKIAFDTEFIREKSFYPQLEIVQVATKDESWLIDAQAFHRASFSDPPPKSIQPFLDLLLDPSYLKVVHAAEGDQECIYTHFGVLANPVLDTAIAASLCGFGENMGLAALTKNVLGVNLKKGYARTNWSSRPLPQQLKEYAHSDVTHLIELADTLLEKLDQLGRRDWAIELSSKWSDPKLYEPCPQNIAKRLAKSGRVKRKNYPVLVELLNWRERKVREINVPRRWLADDDLIMNLAEMRPKNLNLLQSFRGLNQRALQDDGQAIFDAIARGEANTDLEMPQFSKPKAPSTNEARAISLMKCYVEYLANKHNIAARQLIDNKTYIHILRCKPRHPSEWVKQELITPFAAKLIGDELHELLNGQHALTIDKNKISVITKNGVAE